MKKATRKLLLLALSILTLVAVFTSCQIPDNKAGADGKSAYELAVEQGFNGTVEEWLTSLIGAKGDDGVGIEKVEIDYKGAIVITMTNGERYELWAEKFCTHSDMESTITHPTCGEAGYTSYSCSKCGVSYKDDYTAPTGHHLINGECFYCDYVAPYGEIETDTSWFDSSLATYTLTTREQLAGLAYLVNNGNNFSGKTVLVEGHIDLGNAEWIPIGTKDAPFAGTFDGQGFTISGLKITNPTSYVGFFGYVNGTIKNFKLTGANVTVNGTFTIDSYAAIACGYSTNKIVGVSTAGHLNATVTNYVGGVVGFIGNTLQNCSNSAEISAPEASYVGGIAGALNYTGSYDILNLVNSGSVVGANYVGGLIGHIKNHANWNSNDTTYYNKLNGFANSGEIKGISYVGGLIGYAYAAITGDYSDGSTIITVTEANNTANVTGDTYVGGLLGYIYTDNGTSQVLKSASSGTVTAKAYIGGLAGKLENVKLIECSNAGSNIIATYYESDGTTYYAYVGGYAGWGHYFEDCHNTVNITYNERGMYVGGIAGYTVSALVNCSNTADITAEKANYVGGIAGRFNNAGSFDFSDLTNSGKIVGADYVGGLIGSLENIATWNSNDSTYRLNMTRLENIGNVTGYNYVGGFIGHVNAYISGNYSDGSVIFTLTDSKNAANIIGDSYIGGIFGYASTDNGASQITNTTSSGNITAKTYVGGLAGMLSNVKLINCDNTGTSIVATSYIANETTYYAYVGGYAGRSYYVEGCHNKANITYSERGSYVGGVVGEANGSIVNCSNEGTITAEIASYVGGIAGWLNATGNINLTDLNNSGNIVGVNYVGGLIGYFNNHATWNSNDSYYSVSIRNIHNTADISGVKYVAGLIGRVNAQITGSYSDGSVSVTILESDNIGNVTGSESVGSFIGEFYSDRASTLSGYSLTASINGAAATAETIVGVKSGLTITEA